MQPGLPFPLAMDDLRFRLNKGAAVVLASFPLIFPASCLGPKVPPRVKTRQFLSVVIFFPLS